MPLTSAFNTILDAQVTLVSGLGFTWDSTTIPVVKRKIPTREETLDPAVQIVVCKAPVQEKVRFAGFEYTWVMYPSDIVLLAAGDQDFVTHLDDTLGYRERIRDLFMGQPAVAVTGLMDQRVEMGVVWPEKQIASNYDVSVVRVWTRVSNKR